MGRKLVLAFAFIAGAASHTVRARDNSDAAQTAADPAAGIAARMPEVVVVAARRPEPMLEAIGTVSVLDRAAIDRLQAQDIRGLVRYEPGITVTAEPARFGLEGFNIRGVEGNRVAIEIDGVPLPGAFTVGRLSRAGRDTVEPELIERFEVLRGPASTLYGSDALGGIVAITTRAPGDLASPGDPYLGGRLSHASSDQATRASLLGARQGERFGALALVARREGHETENNAGDAGPAANPASSARTSWFLRSDAALPFGTFSATLEHYHAEVDTDVRSARLASGQFANTELLLSDDADERNRAVFAFGLHDAGPLADVIDVDLYWQATRTDQDVYERRRAAPPPAPFPVVRRRSFGLDSDQLGAEFVAFRALQTLGLDHEVLYGAELRQTSVEERRDGRETNLTTGLTRTTILGEQLPVRDFPNSGVTEWAVFLSDELAWPGTRWTLVPGLRLDAYEVDAEPDPVFVADNPDTEIVDLNDKRLSPKLALRYAATDADQLFLAYTEGHRAAPFVDVNIALVLPQFNYVVLPNPALKAERSRGIEGGWNHLTEFAEWRISAFVNDYRDLIESRANLGVDAAGTTIFQSVNRERARIYGVEASAGIDLGRWANALDGVTLRSAFAWTRGDDTRRDEPLNTIAPARLVAGLERRATGWVPELALTATAVAAMHRVDRSTADLFAPPGHVTLDVRARQTWGRHVTLDVSVYNLLDKRYWEWGSLRGITITNDPPPVFFTGPGRHVAITLDVAW